MVEYKYVLLIVLLVVLVFSLSLLNELEAPYLERASLPRCNNNVVLTEELRSSVKEYASNRIIQGTGESYFNNHFIFKRMDYSLKDCLFVVRYEYTYDELYKEMSVTIKVFDEDSLEITETNTFLRPVGLLVRTDEAEAIVDDMNTTYDYYNLEIDVDKQTFLYKFYKETLTEGDVLVLILDGQSKEMIPVRVVKEFVPIV